MKKWISLSLAVMTAISVTACGLIGDNYEFVDDVPIVVVEAGKTESQSGDFWSDTSDGTEDTVETMSQIIIAAEVGQMDDEEDPQLLQEKETGAAVDFGQMIAQEKAKQESQQMTAEETTGVEENTTGTAEETKHTEASEEMVSQPNVTESAEIVPGESASGDASVEPIPETSQVPETAVTIEARPDDLQDAETSGRGHETEKPQENTTAQETPAPSKPQAAETPRAESGISYGIDVSKWQEKIDWQKVKKTGIDFAIIRVGYRTQKTGVIFEDPYARYNLQEAAKAGIKIGAYFFSTAVTKEEALEEAAWMCSVIDQYPITYPVVYDCEGFRSTGSRQYKMTSKQRSDMAVVFLDYVKKKGYKPMFYAAKNELTGSRDWDTERLSSKYPIWVSQYPTIPYPETPKSSYEGEHAMWQYTSQGILDGISKPVDVNVAYFKIDQIAKPKADVSPEVVEDSPELGITFTEVSETVTAKIATNLRTVPSTASGDTVVYKLLNGETITRTGIGDNGWSRVDYHGQSLYAVSSYLTTELPEDANPLTTKSDGPGPGAGDTQSGVEMIGPGGGQAEPDVEDIENSPEQPAESDGGVIETAAQEESASESVLLGPDAAPGMELSDGVYEAVNEQVTAKNRTNLRSKPGSDYTDTIVYTLEHGEVITRTGIGSNGWSRVEYDGQVLYAVTSYLTTDLEGEAQTEVMIDTEPGLVDFPNLTFTPVHEEVTAKIETNLRTEPSTRSDDTVVTKLIRGDVAVRTGLGSNGWSRVEYDGQVLYAVTSYLVTVP